MKNSGQLTNMQKELVKLFNYDLNENQLNDIKKLLSGYFANKATEEMDKFWTENNLSEENIEQWSQEHMRKKR
ncbi:MAG TPA: hypothetical protein VKA34_11370 [Balneolales bacterium]|nr:hypothetical protein [Balneolales bacterium]